MKLIKPSVEIESMRNGVEAPLDGEEILRFIEKIGRTCYKSEDKITDGSAKKFVQKIIKSGHHSVIEHFNISVRFVIDRGAGNELVRHRLASYSQESTRYINYNKRGIEFISPPWITDIPMGEYGLSSIRTNGVDIINTYPEEYTERLMTLPAVDKNQILWLMALLQAEKNYNILINGGWKPEEARSVLPMALKTEIVMTTNLRELRHILILRTSSASHPQIREVMFMLLKDLKRDIPVIFDDIDEL